MATNPPTELPRRDDDDALAERLIAAVDEGGLTALHGLLDELGQAQDSAAFHRVADLLGDLLIRLMAAQGWNLGAATDYLVGRPAGPSISTALHGSVSPWRPAPQSADLRLEVDKAHKRHFGYPLKLYRIHFIGQTGRSFLSVGMHNEVRADDDEARRIDNDPAWQQWWAGTGLHSIELEPGYYYQDDGDDRSPYLPTHPAAQGRRRGALPHASTERPEGVCPAAAGPRPGLRPWGSQKAEGPRRAALAPGLTSLPECGAWPTITISCSVDGPRTARQRRPQGRCAAKWRLDHQIVQFGNVWLSGVSCAP